MRRKRTDAGGLKSLARYSTGISLDCISSAHEYAARNSRRSEGRFVRAHANVHMYISCYDALTFPGSENVGIQWATATNPGLPELYRIPSAATRGNAKIMQRIDVLPRAVTLGCPRGRGNPPAEWQRGKFERTDSPSAIASFTSVNM